MDEILHARNGKIYEEHKNHFIERLRERHGIEITPGEYEQIRMPENIFKNFRGMFKKNQYKTVGFLNIKENKVCVLYNRMCGGVLVTCYPGDCETDVDNVFACTFGIRTSWRKIADIIYRKYKSEFYLVKNLKFESKKEAWFFFTEHTAFAPAFMRHYVYGNVEPWYICNQIKNIILDRSPHARITVEKKILKLK